MAKLLGGRGADVDIRGKSGSTAFDIANMIGQGNIHVYVTDRMGGKRRHT